MKIKFWFIVIGLAVCGICALLSLPRLEVIAVIDESNLYLFLWDFVVRFFKYPVSWIGLFFVFLGFWMK